jgi:hypothetical protein
MFADEYLALVIRPKLVPILADCSSVTELVARFNDQWGCEVSRGRMCEWLRGLGITMQRKVVFSGAVPPPVFRPAAVDLGESDFEKEPLQPIRDVPNQPMFPGFMQAAGGVFANVPAPGFSE